ncbi:MAG: 1-acyl-sn-glycerol-3-phosphate acyltransferase [Phycisphaeraceae bacterium]|nr:MAG: 1-acyl-sn-glycerol-3-phosphate acyltransferase [Phycisphaeraceae bacterium]
MHWMFWTALFLLLWLRFALLVRDFQRLSLRGGDVETGAWVWMFRVYARLMQRMRVEGSEHVPTLDSLAGRALVVVPNHTAGVDPVLVQAAIGAAFETRWMMAEDMRAPGLQWLWDYGRVIFVDRSARDTRAMREALRHLKDGGVLGVFPEGHIERPPRQILPFKGGIGMLVSRTKALVLPAVIEGTPQCDPAWASLWRFGRARVRFLPLIDYQERGVPAAEISEDLRGVFVEATGWPVNDRLPIIGGGRRILVDVDGRYRDEEGRVLDDEEALAIQASLNGSAAS